MHYTHMSYIQISQSAVTRTQSILSPQLTMPVSQTLRYPAACRIRGPTRCVSIRGSDCTLAQYLELWSTERSEIALPPAGEIGLITPRFTYISLVSWRIIEVSLNMDYGHYLQCQTCCTNNDIFYSQCCWENEVVYNIFVNPLYRVSWN